VIKAETDWRRPLTFPVSKEAMNPKLVRLQTSTTEPNISMTHPVNTSDNPQAFTATMYKKGGLPLQL